MKKIALMALGLTGVLASCGGGTVNDSRPPTTDWQLAADVKDSATGQTIRKGTYVICDNANTTVQASASWAAGTERVELLARGVKSGTVKNLGYKTVNPANGGSSQLLFTFGPKMAPLSLNAQSITVNPITRNVKVLGYTNLGIQTRSANGTIVSAPSYSQYSFPVLETCTVS
ncbi:hypothetical protein GCM10017783_25670 [Deinococcus piscis]|uniref:Lipoprotein n=1 Tax=Deinococcus piscis TaxID=394230 RepID=A0ABQ3KC00_9DEIO|nr:hypothetical protein [Deinococcus piscis]GHG12460.1 hypothetical protein GCM10017783_25670 [Deinococcus piscis]